MVPFAVTSRLYGRFPHANVQRGLAAAPFAIPAPGGKSPLRVSRAFFPPATGRARQYVPVLSCPRTAYSAHPWASPLRGQRFALFKNAPGIFVHPVRPGLRRNGAADFFSRSKTTYLTVFIFSRAGKQHASAIVTAIQRWVRIRLPTLQPGPLTRWWVRCAYPPYNGIEPLIV